MTSVGQPMTRVGIPEASLRFGVSQDTLRKKLKAGEISGYQVPAPGGFRWMIELPEVLGENGVGISQLDELGEPEVLEKIREIVAHGYGRVEVMVRQGQIITINSQTTLVRAGKQ